MNTYKIDNQNPRLTNPNQFPYSINNIKKTLTISPGQKYDMAVKHLNEGLNASKSIYSDNNFPLYNNTLSNLPVNMGSKSNIKKRPILNSQKSQRNKKTTPMNKRAKNLNKEITKDININNSFLTNKDYSTINTKSKRFNRINNNPISNTKRNSIYTKTLTNFEVRPARSVIEEPQNNNNNNNLLKQNIFLKRKNNEYIKEINEMNNIINELSNENKMLKIENKKLINNRTNLLDKLKQLESGRNDNSETKRLELLLKRREIEIKNLKDRILFNKESEIKTLDDKIDEQNIIYNENTNINELTNIINNLKFQINNYKEQIQVICNENKMKQNENNKKISELTKKSNSLKEENDVLKNKVKENNELKNRIKSLENTININKEIIEKNNIINNNEYNRMKKDLENKIEIINKLNQDIQTLNNDLAKAKNINEVLSNEIFDLRKENTNNKRKIDDLTEQNKSKEGINQALNKKILDLTNKLDLIKRQNSSFEYMNSSSIMINNLYSSQVKNLEEEYKEENQKYKNNKEKLLKKKADYEIEKVNDKEKKALQNQISMPQNNSFKNSSEFDKDTLNDLQKHKYKLEQLQNEIINAKNDELKRLIYKVVEEGRKNSQIQMEENNSNRLDLQNNYPSISPSQFSDTFKINKQYNDIQMNNINKINNNININSFNDEEMNAMKNEFEEQKKKISSLNEKIIELTANLNKEKNFNKELMTNNNNLNEEIKKLNILAAELKKENIKNQETIMDLSNTNNILRIRVNSVHSGNFKLNAFRSEEKNQELEKQIQQLQQTIEDLQEKVNLLTKGNDNNDNILNIINEKQKISEENRKLQKENLDLQNELLITKAQINENEENENDSLSENAKYLINIKSSIVKNMEKELKELKNQYNERLELLNKKESEFNIMFKNENDIINENKESNNESLYLIEINELKKDIEEKKTKIEKLENELKSTKDTEVTKMLNNYVIENFKKNNINDGDKDYEEQMKIFNNKTSQMSKDEKISLVLNNLRKELEDKNIQIEKLIEENNILKNIKKNNNYSNEETHKEMNTNNHINIKSKENELKSASSNEISEVEKLKLFKNEIKGLKEMNQLDIKQIKALKDEIKELKEKIKKMETFSGQLKNYEEFITLLDSALLNYKPKKKEQKTALKRLMEIAHNHHV